MRGSSNLGSIAPILTAVVLAAFLPEEAGGQCEIAKLVAEDADASDRFGDAVAISGDHAIVSASWDEEDGFRSGSAYLIHVPTGTQLKITAAGAEAEDRFGRSVAISGDLAIVGANRDDDACPADPDCDSGSVYLFDATTGEQMRKLTADDAPAGDLFGTSVAISGDTLIIGAVGNDDVLPGAAYLFEVSTGTQLHRLTAADPESGASFGAAVAISGNVAIVGAPTKDGPAGDTGAAYLFDATTGVQLHKLTAAADAGRGDYFGKSVSMSGSLAVVGSPCPTDAACERSAVYLFDVTTGDRLHRLTAYDAAAGDEFGYSVSINGSLLIVGAKDDDDACPTEPLCNSGSAYLFDVTDPGNPVQIVKFTAGDAAAGDQFGDSVSIAGATVIVGAPFDDDDGSASGGVYLFAAPVNIDCNDNDVPDSCDIADGASLDVNGSGVPDECECLADVDGDGIVAISDHLAVIGVWGPCGEPCPEDVDWSGDVGFRDLLAVLSAWGPCPEP